MVCAVCLSVFLWSTPIKAWAKQSFRECVRPHTYINTPGQHGFSRANQHSSLWRHQMATFPRYWSFVKWIHWSPVDSPHKSQGHGALMFPLICAWTNAWTNYPDAGDLRRHQAHYDVTLMSTKYSMAMMCCAIHLCTFCICVCVQA